MPWRVNLVPGHVRFLVHNACVVSLGHNLPLLVLESDGVRAAILNYKHGITCPRTHISVTPRHCQLLVTPVSTSATCNRTGGDELRRLCPDRFYLKAPLPHFLAGQHTLLAAKHSRPRHLCWPVNQKPGFLPLSWWSWSLQVCARFW